LHDVLIDFLDLTDDSKPFDTLRLLFTCSNYSISSISSISYRRHFDFEILLARSERANFVIVSRDISLLFHLRLILYFRADATDEELEQIKVLCIEGARLVEEERKILREEPCDLMKNFDLFRALRGASELEARNVLPSKGRNPKSKSKGDTDGATDSPGLAYLKPLSADSYSYPDIIREVEASFVSGSASSSKDVKEPSVKTEEGSEGGKGPAEKAGKLVVGAEVAYKQVKMKDDGSQWIQCIIKSITEVGNKKRLASHP
jgi:hypothetical protein